MMTLHGLLVDLFDQGVLDFSGRRTKKHEQYPGAPLAPIYANLRTPDNNDGKLAARLVHEIGLHLAMQVRQMTTDVMPSYICGLPRAGEPFAGVVSSELGIPQLHLAKEELADGKRHLVAPPSLPCAQGQEEVLLIDDVVSSAESKLEAIEALRALGYQVVRLVVFLDRQQDGLVVLQDHGVHGYSVCTLAELLNILVEEGKVTPAQRVDCLDYHQRLQAHIDFIDSS